MDVHPGLVQQLDQGAGAGTLGGLQCRAVPTGGRLGAVARHQQIESELVRPMLLGGEGGPQVRAGDPGAQGLDEVQGRAGVGPRLGEPAQGPLGTDDPILRLRLSLPVSGGPRQPQSLRQALQRFGRLPRLQVGVPLAAQRLGLI